MTTRRRVLVVLAALLLTPVALLAIAIMVVQSEWAERFVEQRIANRIDREVQIEGIDIELGWPPAVNLERLRIGNPAWARTPNLVDATGLHARVAVPPLFRRQIVIPFLSARAATAGLELDGTRASWRFGEQEQEPSPITIVRVQLGDGDIVYRDVTDKTDLGVKVKGSLGVGGELTATASGRFRDEPAKATARIPSLEPSPQTPIRVVADGTIGATRIAIDGSFAQSFDTIDVRMRVAGKSLDDLRKAFRINLPKSPPYSVSGHLKHTGADWIFQSFEGKVGDSDLSGDLLYRTGGKRRFLQANLRSKLLDFDDLGPIVGAPPKTGPGETASTEQKRQAAQASTKDRVLPDDSFSTARWGEMDADVKLEAKRVLRPEALPIDSLSTHIVLNDSLLKLQPLSFGVAGGRVSSDIVLDGRRKPMRGDLKIDVKGLDLGRLFPAEETKQSLGTLYGSAKLAGSGGSIGDLLGTSSGQIHLAIDGGRFSLLLIELLGLDVAEALQLLGTRNRQVTLRCAVADLQVKDGIAAPQLFVVDTTDTNVTVNGAINFKTEQLDLVSYPEPKDPSIFVLRSPIHLEGALKRPKVRPEAGPIAARIAAAAALAAVNPLLALIPFIETGPGKDSDCAALVSQLNQKIAEAKRR
jgi:uncharacterized protein involved in outer membrane biogenesis